MLSAVAIADCLMLLYITLALSDLETTSAREKKELTDQLEKEKQNYATGITLYTSRYGFKIQKLPFLSFRFHDHVIVAFTVLSKLPPGVMERTVFHIHCQ